ncbi:hypothetical protein [Amycolatopsis sp. lyj-346]|uniref:hypothetical protein n=1 Tax=Amycolatopsis sp. lyj-346 TaxID=2789289 RepID=UPI00397B6878
MTDDGFGDDWILEPVPWRELSRPVAAPDDPLIGAGRVLPHRGPSRAGRGRPGHPRRRGVTGLLPRTALVVKNCAGNPAGEREFADEHPQIPGRGRADLPGQDARERDAAALYAVLDVTCNENEPVPPEVLAETITSAYGEGNEPSASPSRAGR